MVHHQLEYNFHDSILISCEMKSPDRLNMQVMLYEILYPTKDQISLNFSEIYNVEKVHGLIQKILQDPLEPNWNGTRIDALHYNPKKTSKDLHHHLLLAFDGFKPINLHCKKLRIVKVQ